MGHFVFKNFFEFRQNGEASPVPHPLNTPLRLKRASVSCDNDEYTHLKASGRQGHRPSNVIWAPSSAVDDHDVLVECS